MEAAHKKLLRDQHVFLVENLEPSPVFYSHLFSNRILTQDLIEEIRNKYVNTSRSREVSDFLQRIVRRGPRAFPIMVQALVESEQDHIADRLDKTIADGYRAAKNPGFVPAAAPAGDAVAANNVGLVPAVQPVGDALPANNVGFVAAVPPAGGAGGGDVVDATNPELTFQVQNASPEAIKMALTERYPMSSHPRGRAIIVNVENFKPGAKKSVRTGSSVDCINLKKLCEQLSFTVEVWEDPTKEDLVEKIKQERAREDHSEADTFMMFILSHGSEGVFYTVEGESVNITQQVISQFNGKNCKQLIGKPKMFFIQSCQGAAKTLGVVPDGGPPPEPETKPDTDGSRDEFLKKATHEDADILVTYATVEGYESYRDTEKGTWFIRDLVQVFAKYAHLLDVSRMVIMVSGLVDKHQDHKYKQVCVTKASLKRVIYLLPGFRDSLDHV